MLMGKVSRRISQRWGPCEHHRHANHARNCSRTRSPCLCPRVLPRLSLHAGNISPTPELLGHRTPDGHTYSNQDRTIAQTGPGRHCISDTFVELRACDHRQNDGFSKVQPRFGNGLSFLSNYTYRHALGDASNANLGAQNNDSFRYSADQQWEHGNLDFEVRHCFKAIIRGSCPSGGAEHSGAAPVLWLTI